MRIPASKLIGRSVRNDRGEDLGEIDDLLIDLNDGQIRYAVLSFGGLFRFRRKHIAIPLPLLQISKGGNCVLGASRIAVERTPGFSKDDWPASANGTQLDIVRRYNKVSSR